jgi:rhodanese-related sulfurtransferase
MVQQIGVRELAQRLENGEKIQLLDVRKTWEHRTAALPNSLLIPLDELPTRWHEIPGPEAGLLVAYCHHGIRSLSAASFLEQSGIRPVASLAGGIDAWSVEVDPAVPRY